MELRRRFNRIFLMRFAAFRAASKRLCASFSCFPVYSRPRPLSYACARKVVVLPVGVDEALAIASPARDSDRQCEPSLGGLCSAVTSSAVHSLIMSFLTISSLVDLFCAALRRRRLCTAQHAGVAFFPLGSDSVASSSSAMGVAGDSPRHAGVYGVVTGDSLSLLAAGKPPMPLHVGLYKVVEQTIDTIIIKPNGMPSVSAMPLEKLPVI